MLFLFSLLLLSSSRRVDSSEVLPADETADAMYFGYRSDTQANVDEMNLANTMSITTNYYQDVGLVVVNTIAYIESPWTDITIGPIGAGVNYRLVLGDYYNDYHSDIPANSNDCGDPFLKDGYIPDTITPTSITCTVMRSSTDLVITITFDKHTLTEHPELLTPWAIAVSMDHGNKYAYVIDSHVYHQYAPRGIFWTQPAPIQQEDGAATTTKMVYPQPTDPIHHLVPKSVSDSIHKTMIVNCNSQAPYGQDVYNDAEDEEDLKNYGMRHLPMAARKAGDGLTTVPHLNAWIKTSLNIYWYGDLYGRRYDSNKITDCAAAITVYSSCATPLQYQQAPQEYELAHLKLYDIDHVHRFDVIDEYCHRHHRHHHLEVGDEVRDPRSQYIPPLHVGSKSTNRCDGSAEQETLLVNRAGFLYELGKAKPEVGEEVGETSTITPWYIPDTSREPISIRNEIVVQPYDPSNDHTITLTGTGDDDVITIDSINYQLVNRLVVDIVTTMVNNPDVNVMTPREMDSTNNRLATLRSKGDTTIVLLGTGCSVGLVEDGVAIEDGITIGWTLVGCQEANDQATVVVITSIVEDGGVTPYLYASNQEESSCYKHLRYWHIHKDDSQPIVLKHFTRGVHILPAFTKVKKTYSMGCIAGNTISGESLALEAQRHLIELGHRVVTSSDLNQYENIDLWMPDKMCGCNEMINPCHSKSNKNKVFSVTVTSYSLDFAGGTIECGLGSMGLVGKHHKEFPPDRVTVVPASETALQLCTASTPTISFKHPMIVEDGESGRLKPSGTASIRCSPCWDKPTKTIRQNAVTIQHISTNGYDGEMSGELGGSLIALLAGSTVVDVKTHINTVVRFVLDTDHMEDLDLGLASYTVLGLGCTQNNEDDVTLSKLTFASHARDACKKAKASIYAYYNHTDETIRCLGHKEINTCKNTPPYATTITVQEHDQVTGKSIWQKTYTNYHERGEEYGVETVVHYPLTTSSSSTSTHPAVAMCVIHTGEETGTTTGGTQTIQLLSEHQEQEHDDEWCSTHRLKPPKPGLRIDAYKLRCYLPTWYGVAKERHEARCGGNDADQHTPVLTMSFTYYDQFMDQVEIKQPTGDDPDPGDLPPTLMINSDPEADQNLMWILMGARFNFTQLVYDYGVIAMGVKCGYLLDDHDDDQHDHESPYYLEKEPVAPYIIYFKFEEAILAGGSDAVDKLLTYREAGPVNRYVPPSPPSQDYDRPHADLPSLALDQSKVDQRVVVPNRDQWKTIALPQTTTTTSYSVQTTTTTFATDDKTSITRAIPQPA